MTVSVLVKLNDSTRELIDDLGKMAPRARAERLRVLAMLGLMAVRNGRATAAHPDPAARLRATKDIKYRLRRD